MFKVNGIPEIDLISGEVDDTEEDDNFEPHPVEEKGIENPIVKGVKSIGDVFVTMIRNVVFKTSQNSSLTMSLNSSSLVGSSLRHVLRTGSADFSQERLDVLTYILSTQYHTIRQYLYTMSVRGVLQETCCEYGFSLYGEGVNTTQSWQWLGFLSVVHGEDFILALCNVLSIELGLSDEVKSGDLVIANSTTAVSGQVTHNKMSSGTGLNANPNPSTNLGNNSDLLPSKINHETVSNHVPATGSTNSSSTAKREKTAAKVVSSDSTDKSPKGALQLT